MRRVNKNQNVLMKVVMLMWSQSHVAREALLYVPPLQTQEASWSISVFIEVCSGRFLVEICLIVAFVSLM
ncbi:hypothetical protein RHGRI_022215 [Rhododendron griersonianum]|uniref:Uncharacterized protein n=1 Tax=Rhododendron griersonianum TaxID=479676 RepID=A0AAV6JT99_9ERIC|nr:hypothetical protein RHGRI_022215 [Rhododendron griersonianum]